MSKTKMNQFIKSTCTKNWVTKDGRIVFKEGVRYTHAKTAELSIKGESSIVMWMSSENYNQHFKQDE